MTIYTIRYPGDGYVLIPLFIINVVLLIYEFAQMVLGGIIYWENVWNIFDLLRFIVFNIYAIFLWVSFFSDRGMAYLLALLTLLSWIRGITYFRIFSNTRYLINMLTEVSKDITSFLVLLLYSTLAFGVIFYTIQDDPDLHIKDYLTISFLLDLNENNTENFSSIEWVIFVLATLINSIIMLNLLISIMSDTYARVGEGIIVADSKELTEMIIDCEMLLFWKRQKDVKKYLQMCIEEGTKDQSEWGGTVREIKESILVMKDMLEQNNKKAITRVEELVKGVSEIVTKIDEEREKNKKADNDELFKQIESEGEARKEKIVELTTKFESILKTVLEKAH